LNAGVAASEVRLKLKAQLYCGDEIAMGPGKAALLESIDTHRSISGAARALGMSYRRAWLLVDVMNRCWQSPLVETSMGGARGGGAHVTSLGRDVLGHYRALETQLEAATASTDWAALVALVRTRPLARTEG
jgi:molybdate transport system regulatory protein